MTTSSVWEQLPDAVLVVAADGTVEAFNSLAGSLLGLVEADLGSAATSAAPVMLTTGEDLWACIPAMTALPRVTRSPERILPLGHDAARGRPRETQVGVSMRFVRTSAGSLERTVVVLRDTRAADRAGRSSADLVSTVAHELRSPLTSVKGFTATLLAKWDRFPDEQKKLMLATVNADADRVTRLLTELLDVSRIDAGRLEMRRQVVSLSAVVRKTFAGRVASGEAEDRFVLSTDDAQDAILPELWLDPDKVEQVIGNLVENAVRHGDGTVEVSITRSSTPAGAWLVIRDSGPGIPADVIGRVFTKFWRAGSRRGGTGLGLYIVKGLVEAHGGTVEAGRSAVTGGAEFRVLLPAGIPPYEEA